MCSFVFVISSSFRAGCFPYFSRKVLGDRLAKRDMGGWREREREIETDIEAERLRG